MKVLERNYFRKSGAGAFAALFHIGTRQNSSLRSQEKENLRQHGVVQAARQVGQVSYWQRDKYPT